MIVSVDLKTADKKRLDEVRIMSEATTNSEVLRCALREYHKKFLDNSLSIVRNGRQQIPTEHGNKK